MSLLKAKNVQNERFKTCKVKFPAVVLPVFFENPTKIEPNVDYQLVINFTFTKEDSRQDWPAYLMEYKKYEEVIDFENAFEFHEPKIRTVERPCKCAYVQCGQIRLLYFWPC